MNALATPTSPITPPLWLHALIAGAGSAVVNVLIYAVGVAAGASMIMNSPQTMTIPWAAAIVASLVPLGLAGLVTWFVVRRFPRARIWFAWTGLVVAVLSCAAVITAPDIATAVSLGAMHVVAGVAWFLALTVGITKRNN